MIHRDLSAILSNIALQLALLGGFYSSIYSTTILAGSSREECFKRKLAESEKSQSIQIAREIVDNLEQTFSTKRARRCSFILSGTAPPCLEKSVRTTGFPRFEEFVARLEKDTAIDPRYSELATLIESEQLQVAIILDESKRTEVLRSGILNGHQTGVFRGTGNAAARNYTEAFFLDMEDRSYFSLPAEVKPKYGLIRPARGGGLNVLSYEARFGTDAWILNLDKIRDRLTWSPGDSLNRYSVLSRTGGFTGHATFWDQLFIPWKYRLLLAPFLKQHFEEIERVFRGPFPNTDAWPSDVRGSLANGSFAEIQVLGPIDPTDITVLEYGGSAPDDEQAKLLKSAGIMFEKMVIENR